MSVFGEWVVQGNDRLWYTLPWRMMRKIMDCIRTEPGHGHWPWGGPKR